MKIDNLEKLMKVFLRKYDAKLSKYRPKLSTYFEMKMYNEVVRAYEENGYTVKVANLFEDKVFKYKNTTNGYFENFSHFEVEKNDIQYLVIHNLKVQHKFYRDCYITPDISVIKKGTIKRVTVNAIKMDVVENENLITFFEVKQMPPFPELIAGFIGLVHELAIDFIFKCIESVPDGNNISPTLLCSGHGSKPVKKYIEETEYSNNINVMTNMSFKTLKAAVRKKEIQLFNGEERDVT